MPTNRKTGKWESEDAVALRRFNSMDGRDLTPKKYRNEVFRNGRRVRKPGLKLVSCTGCGRGEYPVRKFIEMGKLCDRCKDRLAQGETISVGAGVSLQFKEDDNG